MFFSDNMYLLKKYLAIMLFFLASCQDTVLENRVDSPQDGVQLYGVEMGNVQTHIHVQNNKHVQQDQFDVENKSTIQNEVQQMADVQLQNEVQQMTDVQLQNEVQQLNESNLLPNNLEKQQNQKVDPVLASSIQDFAQINANLKEKYKAVGQASDLSSMVREMVNSLSGVQERGESMMKNILVHQKRLKYITAEIKQRQKYLTQLNIQISDLEINKNKTKIEIFNANREIQGRKLENEEEMIRLAEELNSYETRISEARKILSEIEENSRLKKAELMEIPESKLTAEPSQLKSPVPVEILVPGFLISLILNLLMGGQVLNLYSLEELAQVAALSIKPNTIEDDDPLEQLAQIKMEKEKIFGKKSEYLRRKNVNFSKNKL
ncbi:spindle assembly abnormal protein 6 homolog isoform X2 [Eurytemora carolleeae]|uniref:spindle assembly abnormal protein 6 homolog isoform X2 n=1 Tax=Eurytemora carolleeae TaxID=1294199 RepID=UPI000C7878D0|nr:spindle assembly abnormal protein 6 homolog isoform X2 [Eurytemora carolleeae]|eukprot:XP_023326483.1 spindle assembly abnormal protein 6 homolog isoform X2 [Eurytemora affinis]